MRCKQAVNEVADLDRSKRRQHLRSNDERATASQNAGGKVDYGRQPEQYQGDYAET
jgi:hypothetical protein